MLALLELDCIPSGMELFPAANEDQWTLIKQVIDDCDYYVVIIGGRYGSLHASGKSYTQMEYEYALSKGKPTIAFLHHDPAAIPAGKTESSTKGKQKLAAFRELTQTKIVKFWSSPSDLGSKVSRGVTMLMKRHPGIGWVRANELSSATAPEMLRLRRKIDELESQLSKTAKARPLGSEELAQQDDEYVLNFDVEFKDHGGNVVWENEYWQEATWNDIFGVIAPFLIGRVNESDIRTILASGFRKQLLKIAKADSDLKRKKWSRGLRLSKAILKLDDLKTVIIQLRALGLITDERVGSSVYWRLTPLGDDEMTRLKAIRKGGQARGKKQHGPRAANDRSAT